MLRTVVDVVVSELDVVVCGQLVFVSFFVLQPTTVQKRDQTSKGDIDRVYKKKQAANKSRPWLTCER